MSTELAAEEVVLFQQPDIEALLQQTRRRCHSGSTRPDDDDFRHTFPCV